MEDLSLHILDIAENSTNAGADLIEIEVIEDEGRDLLSITVRDNGKGIEPEILKGATDPFVTTRTTRRVGLGLPLLEQAAREAEGDFSIRSEPAKGTEVKATFRSGHIDRKPLGDMGSTLISLIMGNPNVDFVYHYQSEYESFILDTREIRAELDGSLPMSHPAVIGLIEESFNSRKDDPAKGPADKGGKKDGQT